MIKLVSVLLTFVLFSLPNEVSAYFIDSTTVNGTAINSTKVNGTAVNSATVNGNPDIKAKKTAAIIYQLFFFIDFNNAQKEAQPEFCFVGEKSFLIGEILKKTHESRKQSIDVSISNWQQASDVPLSYCHIIYNADPKPSDKEIIKALSEESMTIANNVNLKETGNIASISFQGTAVTFVFSRKHLRRSSLEVNHQLIRASVVIP